MTYEFGDYREVREGTRRQQAEAAAPRLQQIAQAAVAAHLLTNDPSWDMFLRMIQAAIEATERQIVVARETLESPAVVNADDIARTRNVILQCRERLLAWKAVLELPKEIKEKGEKARTVLERMEAA